MSHPTVTTQAWKWMDLLFSRSNFQWWNGTDTKFFYGLRQQSCAKSPCYRQEGSEVNQPSYPFFFIAFSRIFSWVDFSLSYWATILSTCVQCNFCMVLCSCAERFCRYELEFNWSLQHQCGLVFISSPRVFGKPVSNAVREPGRLLVPTQH